MKTKETKTKKQILCGYTSAHQVCQHATRRGSICLVTGTPYKEGVMGLSLERSLDDMHHPPEDCFLIGTHLNDATTQKLHTRPSGPRKLLHSTAGKWGLMNLLPIMQICVLYSGLSSKG